MAGTPLAGTPLAGTLLTVHSGPGFGDSFGSSHNSGGATSTATVS
jgi:hypothetical protein